MCQIWSRIGRKPIDTGKDIIIDFYSPFRNVRIVIRKRHFPNKKLNFKLGQYLTVYGNMSQSIHHIDRHSILLDTIYVKKFKILSTKNAIAEREDIELCDMDETEERFEEINDYQDEIIDL